MVKVASIGWCIARVSHSVNSPDKLAIVSPSSEGEGVFIPAQSVEVYGADNIKALRDLLNEFLEEVDG